MPYFYHYLSQTSRKPPRAVVTNAINKMKSYLGTRKIFPNYACVRQSYHRHLLLQLQKWTHDYLFHNDFATAFSDFATGWLFLYRPEKCTPVLSLRSANDTPS